MNIKIRNVEFCLHFVLCCYRSVFVCVCKSKRFLAIFTLKNVVFEGSIIVVYIYVFKQWLQLLQILFCTLPTFLLLFFKTKSTVIFQRKQTNRFSYFRQKSSIWSFSEGKIYTIHWNEGIQFSRACASTNIVFFSNWRIMLSNAQ